jgi:hypothetical protein
LPTNITKFSTYSQGFSTDQQMGLFPVYKITPDQQFYWFIVVIYAKHVEKYLTARYDVLQKERVWNNCAAKQSLAGSLGGN